MGSYPLFSPEDTDTDEVIYSQRLTRFLRLILQSLLNRRTYVRFDKRGDIIGEYETDDFLRPSRFYSFRMNEVERRLELTFDVDDQIKELLLRINDIKKLETFEIYFQYPESSDRVLINLFSYNEFIKPHPDSENLKWEFNIEILISFKVLIRKEQNNSSSEVRFYYPFSDDLFSFSLTWIWWLR